MVTSTKTKALSFGAILTLETSLEGIPSTFILNTEVFPLAIQTLSISMVWLYGFLIINLLVEEPIVVKTVSKNTVSAENSTIASFSLYNLSLRHEEKSMILAKNEKKTTLCNFMRRKSNVSNRFIFRFTIFIKDLITFALRKI